ncbi:MAG TPA: preprotein translocase subunit SecG [Longimicrobiales bacterium]
MFGFLLTLLILDGLVLMAVVLLQAGKGGGLAAMGGGAGTETFLGGRQAATLLTRTTWVTGGIFLFLALVLSIMSSRQRLPESILQQEFQQTAPAPQPVIPGVQQPEGAAQPETGAATTSPAAATPGTQDPPTQP